MQPDSQTREWVEEFYQRGFLVIEKALDAHQLEQLNRAVDQDLQNYPQEWVHFSRSLQQTVDVLPRTSAFDVAIENPKTLKILCALLGEAISLEEFSIILRNPSSETEDIKSWHRDIIRDFERRMEIQALSLVYYLTDVSENDHCFSIVPETHYRLVDMKPADVVPGSECDVIGPAGTALVFHARCLHAGKLKRRSRPRRTLHLYYGRADQPRTSEWTTIPARLQEKKDTALPPFLYSKSKMGSVIEGTGKKPRDVDPSLTTVQC